MKVWIEAALNGPWSRRRQPSIPDTVDAIVADGIACATEGACIIHVHAYDGGGGPQTFDWQVYARIIESIRAKADVPVYPSISSAGIGVGPLPTEAAQRFAHVEALAARGLLEFAVIDPGSVNFTELSIGRDTPPASTYLNPEAHVRYALEFARYGFHPAYAIYEPGFTRSGAALARALGTRTPLYRLMFSETFAYGFPPKPYALAAHRALLEEEAPGAPWMIAGLGVDVRPLIQETVRAGGHVRIGLEDAPFGTTATNVALVKEAVRLIRAAGGEPATVAEMRTALTRV